MIDLINSMLPLFGNAQCVGMKNASPEMLRKMEELFTEKNIEAPYAMLRHLNQNTAPSAMISSCASPGKSSCFYMILFSA